MAKRMMSLAYEYNKSDLLSKRDFKEDHENDRDFHFRTSLRHPPIPVKPFALTPTPPSRSYHRRTSKFFRSMTQSIPNSLVPTELHKSQ